METLKNNQKRKVAMVVSVMVLSILLLISIGFNIYYTFWGFDSYLQSTEEIYVMESGILYNNLEFAEGKDIDFLYDFEHEDYITLRETYDIEKTAGEGTELERVLRLMNEYAPRLTHKSNYGNEIEMSSLSLLEYSLDNSKQGINCRAKAQILNEMCLALGIYARKVWIMPYSGYDGDCHVVNEIWDNSLNKWVMLDITNNEYWIDENGMPLSVLEIREKGALQEFCTPVYPEESTANPTALKEKHIGSFVYIMKNMVYMEYCSEYTVGEGFPIVRLSSETLMNENKPQISKTSCECAPKN